MMFRIQLDHKKVYREISIVADDYKEAMAVAKETHPNTKIVYAIDADGVYFYETLDWDRLDGVYDYYYNKFTATGDEIDDLTSEIIRMQHERLQLHAQRSIIGRQLHHLRELKDRKELEDHAEARDACKTVAGGE